MVLGIVSRSIDTAPWAQPWFGLVVLPWLLAAWLAGAWLAPPDDSVAWGAFGGLVLLGATVAAYLVAAGELASLLLPRLAVLVIIAGPLFGATGAAIHGGPGARVIAVLTVGAAAVAQALLLFGIGPSLP